MTSDRRRLVRSVRQMGIRWAGKRALYELRRRSGWLEARSPARPWSSYDAHADGARLLCNMERFPLRLPEKHWQPPPPERLDEIRAGCLRLFDNDPVDTGWPPRWLEEPGSRRPWDLRHWSRYESLGDRDVKITWEPGRFAFTWTLLRAYAADRSCGAAELFWQAVASFREANPPNMGPHWMCGQEASLRALALACGLAGFREDPATTPERVAALAALLEATGDRVEANLGYALLQNNNHGLVESLGLMLLGCVLEGQPRAARWRERGWSSFMGEVRRQVAEDGTYVQHSYSYHRFAMEALTWAALLRESFDGDGPDDLLGPLDGMAIVLDIPMQIPPGRVPVYGSTDGARLMRLDGCDSLDVRPSIVAARRAAKRHRSHCDDGPWDEPLDWLVVPGERPPRPGCEGEDPCHLPIRDWESGYHRLHTGSTTMATRCTVYASRPGQADMTHVDIWWMGHNLVCDPGTYAYNAQPPWNNGLATTRVHNAVTVDGLDQMERGPRFMWSEWTRGRSLPVRQFLESDFEVLRLEHDGYERRLGITTRRSVIGVHHQDLWIVVDELLGEGEHEASSQWLFPRATLASPVADGGVRLDTPWGPCGFAAADIPAEGDPIPVDAEVHCGDEDDTLGWYSLRYMHREAAPGLVVRSRRALPMRRVTVIAAGGPVPRIGRDGADVVVDAGVRVRLDADLDDVRIEEGGA